MVSLIRVTASDPPRMSRVLLTLRFSTLVSVTSVPRSKALRKAGCDVVGLVSIFSYGFEEATRNFAEAKCRLISLCSYDSLIDFAIEHNYVQQTEAELLREWRLSPSTWGQEVSR